MEATKTVQIPVHIQGVNVEGTNADYPVFLNTYRAIITSADSRIRRAVLRNFLYSSANLGERLVIGLTAPHLVGSGKNSRAAIASVESSDLIDNMAIDSSSITIPCTIWLNDNPAPPAAATGTIRIFYSELSGSCATNILGVLRLECDAQLADSINGDLFSEYCSLLRQCGSVPHGSVVREKYMDFDSTTKKDVISRESQLCNEVHYSLRTIANYSPQHTS